MENLSQIEIKNKIIEAVELLLEYDYHLLEINAHERSISHRLAVYLEKKFNSWYVDCEYNRVDDGVKRLMEVWEGEKPIKPDDTDAKTVYPDIIIHQRRKKEENLLVIEMKKTTSSVKDEVDIKKLKKFKEQLKYRYRVFLKIKTDFQDEIDLKSLHSQEVIDELKFI